MKRSGLPGDRKTLQNGVESADASVYDGGDGDRYDKTKFAVKQQKHKYLAKVGGINEKENF